jgi:hypothetical protein
MSLSKFGLLHTSFVVHQKLIIVAIITSLVILPLRAWSSEATLQVAFVYNFIKFIEWPTTESTSSIRLCVVGANKEMYDALNQLDGKTANKLVIELVYITPEMSVNSLIKSCQMVYQPSRSNILLPSPLPRGVVLVANNPAAEDLDVSIALMRNTQARIEFMVNQSAVTYSGVKMSSQLLKLAVNTQEARAK